MKQPALNSIFLSSLSNTCDHLSPCKSLVVYIIQCDMSIKVKIGRYERDGAAEYLQCYQQAFPDILPLIGALGLI